MPDTSTAVRFGASIEAENADARAVGVFAPAGLESAFPRWLRAVDLVHRGSRSPLPLVIDLGVLVATAAFAGIAWPWPAAIGVAGLVLLYIAGIYGDRCSLETQGVLWFWSVLAAPAAVATLAGVGIAQAAGWNIGLTLAFGGLAAAGLVGLRILSWAVLVVARRKGYALHRALIVGNSDHARMLSRKLREFPEAGLLPVAVLRLGNGSGFSGGVPEFPNEVQLARAIEESEVQHVVLAPDGGDEAILECVKGSNGLDVGFSILPPMSELFLHPSMVTQVGGLPLIPLGRIAQGHRTLPGKRAFDLIVGSALLVLASPVLALTAIAIKIFDGGPVLYRQPRVGHGGTMFKMLKFRSMVVGAERMVIDLRDQNVNNGLLFKVHADPRITRVGRIIRRLSIDELPQLWNLMRGEMSLVGPRPLPVNPEDFNAIDSKRHTVRPGITGYWQIAGAHGLSYEEMVKLDLTYIQNWSLWTDIRILFRTVPALVHRRGPF